MIKPWLLCLAVCMAGKTWAEDPLIENIIVTPEAVVPEEILSDFIGKATLEKTLLEVQERVLAYLENQGQFAVTASYPEQDISSGTIVLNVSYPTIESIQIKGNKWQSNSFYEKQIGLAIGDSLDTAQLLNTVAWDNRNPFRYAEVIVAPNTDKGVVDLEMLVKDRFAFRPFAGADNTGTNLTDTTRLWAGVSWGKAFGRSDILTYQYISAPNPSKFFAHIGSYLIFLPWKHELLFFGGYSAIHPNIPSFTHEGISVQASFRYGIPIKPLYQPKLQTFTFGIDYKNINSNVFFIEAGPAIPVIAHQATITQAYLSYAWEKNELIVKAELLGSPCSWLPNQTESRYHQLRPHSRVEYIYGRFALGDLYGKIENVSFGWLLRAQGASGPLLPSEQFGLGGYDTVRGYEERDFLADNMACLNLELRAPRLSFFRKKDELIFLAFTDIAGGYNFQSEQSSETKQYLWSTGLGARYQIAPYLTFRADYGFQLHHIFGEDQLGRFHLGGSLSY